jgi:hypothetical protein
MALDEADTLEAFLETNLRAVEERALQLKSNGSLTTMLIAVTEGVVAVSPVVLQDGDGAARDLEMSLFRARLQAIGADRYAIVSAAWYVAATDADKEEVEAAVNREGTGGRYKERRQECLVVTAGDRTRTLLAILDVERDYKGKIRKLTRRASADSANLAGGLRGRLTDLLVTRH